MNTSDNFTLHSTTNLYCEWDLGLPGQLLILPQSPSRNDVPDDIRLPPPPPPPGGEVGLALPLRLILSPLSELLVFCVL